MSSGVIRTVWYRAETRSENYLTWSHAAILPCHDRKCLYFLKRFRLVFPTVKSVSL